MFFELNKSTYLRDKELLREQLLLEKQQLQVLKLPYESFMATEARTVALFFLICTCQAAPNVAERNSELRRASVAFPPSL